jgi:hypothetical protein
LSAHHDRVDLHVGKMNAVNGEDVRQSRHPALPALDMSSGAVASGGGSGSCSSCPGNPFLGQHLA